MIALLLKLCLILACGSLFAAQKPRWQPAPGHTQVPIWPGTPPDAQFGPPANTETMPEPGEIDNVSRPTMTVYSPKGKNTGAAVLVFPGGGYFVLAIDIEGTEVCDWLISKGITCVLLKYRVPKTGPHWDERCRCQMNPKAPLALEDAQRTLGLLRYHSGEYHIDPHKIGVLGFSAGGHLVTDISTHFEKRAYAAVDAADKESCRPDFAVALYPGHLWLSSYKNLELNPDVRVTRRTPPTFLLQAENDPVDSVNNSLIALKNAGVPAEMHLYAEGKHAFGLRLTKYPITRWPGLVETWLGTIGMIPQQP